MGEYSVIWHVTRNTARQWAGATVLYALLFWFFMWYHAVRGRPYSLFVANKCVGIAAAFLIGFALSLGPLARRWKWWQQWLPHRRSLGLFGVYAGVVHALVSLFGSNILGFPQDGQFNLAWYLEHWPCGVLGFLALALLLAIASYSYPDGLRRLGADRWLRLQALSWLVLPLLLGHLIFKGTTAKWIAWLQTFDKPFPPGAMTTALFLVAVLLLGAVDRTRKRAGNLTGTNGRGLTCMLAALLLAAGMACGCGRAGPAQLRVLCGSSMAAPIQELGQEFGRVHGVTVEFDLGGSETLLPKILAGVPADIYVCHDPFEAKVREAGRLAGCVTVGHLEPVLAVRPGNPLGIRSVDDLLRAGLRIGMGDPRYSTCGELFVRALQQRGIHDAVMRQVVLQARSITDVANGLVVGPLDAAVLWNFSAVLYSGKLERVSAPLGYPEVRVTVVGLAGSPHPQWRDAFLHWCERPEARAVFRKHGYTRLPGNPAQEAL